ncbi:energy coupling factor transporter S component ThiW [Atribacter laminatus]|jgi:energy coupling factor transporter S component ThiW|nr:energy coupling factor transporter S component ThiW [Atribacter laminatus]
MKKNYSIRLFTYTALFAALAVLGSFVHFPIGPVKVFPFQHAINVAAGIMIGPWYGMVAAFLAALVRLMMGTGTVFAFPGGIPGVLVVGALYHYFFRRDWVGFLEPIGTVLVGATLSAYLVAPWMEMSATLSFFQISFLFSSFPGSIIGFLLIKVLRKLPWLNIELFNGGE